MPLEFAHGAIDWLTSDAVSATKTVSALSFQPKAIRFYWMGLQSGTTTASQTVHMRAGLGFASSTTERRCIGVTSLDAAAAADTDCGAFNDCVAVLLNAAGAVDGKIDLNSITSDGFTLIVDDQSTAQSVTIFWEAWGGSDITNVTIGDIAEPAATGTQNYTANGFVTNPSIFDQVVMFSGCQSTAAVNTGAINDSGWCVGFSSGTGNRNIHICGNSDEASATMDTGLYFWQGECLSMTTVAGGNPSARAAVSGWGTNQFTLNWFERTTTSRRYIYMAIKGGAWSADMLTINANTLNATATVSGLPFTPKGISVFAPMSVAVTRDASTTNARFSLGSGSSTSSRRAMSFLDENATADAEINLTINYAAIVSLASATGTEQAAIDINAMNSNGFQLIADSNGGVANNLLFYLAFGDNYVAKSRPIFRKPIRHYSRSF
jgi:hypothetical protein